MCDQGNLQEIRDSSEAITISYEDIVSEKDLSVEVEAAFGPTGLGLILIKDYPDFSEKRNKVLRTIREFALLPETVKEKYALPEANYSFGWSHGKEKMKSGIPDFAKGSYYARPHGDVITDDVNLKKKYPGNYADNVWPREECPELEHSFKDMTKVHMDLGHQITRLIDRYLNKKTGGSHNLNTFYHSLKDSPAYKGRMLHYYPVHSSINSSMDGLCGWHLDHGCITCLLSPLYFDPLGSEVPKPANCGLYVKSPVRGVVHQVDIPPDCLAIQVGEFFQLLSGGFLRATPHCVRSASDPNISRSQLVVFMDCEPDQEVALPGYSGPYEEVVTTPFLPEGVPKLCDRLVGANTFKDFCENTYKAYLEPPPKN